jgi:hypothetical protein
MYQPTRPCQCPACPGAACTCGCQQPAATQPAAQACQCGPKCQCGPGCQCDAAESGCVCNA